MFTAGSVIRVISMKMIYVRFENSFFASPPNVVSAISKEVVEQEVVEQVGASTTRQDEENIEGDCRGTFG